MAAAGQQRAQRREVAVVQAFLERLRGQVRAQRLREAGVIGAAWALAWLMGVTVAAALLPPWGLWVVAAWASLVGGLGWIVWARALPAWRLSLREVASQAESLQPALRNDLVTALQFGAEAGPGADGVSEALIRAHLVATTRQVARHLQRLDALVGRAPLQGFQQAIVGVGGALVAVWLSFDGSAARATLWLRGLTPAAAAALSNDGPQGPRAPTPLAVGLEVALTPPAYAGERPKLLKNTSGHLQGVLKGTQVAVTMTPAAPATEVALVVEDAEGQEVARVQMTQADALDGGAPRFAGAWVASASGRYRFELTTKGGEVWAHDIPRPLEVVADPEPQVSVKSAQVAPRRDAKDAPPYGPHRVAASSVVTLTIEAADERRLTEVALRVVHEGEEMERRVIAAGRELGGASYQGQVEVTLAKLLQADLKTPLEYKDGDRLALVIEALDNDDVSGPKAGKAPPVLLEFVSLESEHEALLAREQEVFDALLMLLADYLSHPVLLDEPGHALQDDTPNLPAGPAHAIASQAADISTARGRVLEAFAQLLGDASHDPLMLKRDHMLMSSLYQRLYDLHRDDIRRLDALQRALTHGTAPLPTPQANPNAADPPPLPNATSAPQAAAAPARPAPPRAPDLAAAAFTTAASTSPPDAIDAHLIALGAHRILQVHHTEIALIRLEELIASQWMDAMQMTAEQIRALSADLKSKLQRYKEASDPALKQEIMKDIERLKRKMQDLQARLARQIQQMPQEFMNAEAFKESAQQSAQDLQKNINDLSQLLDDGDIDGLLDALAQMEQDLDKMIAMIDQNASGNSGGGGGPSPMDQMANDLMDAVNDLVGAQAALEADSQQLTQDVQAADRDALQKALQPTIDAAQQQLAQMDQRLQNMQRRGQLDPSDRAAVADLQRQLDAMKAAADASNLDALSESTEPFSEATREARYQMFRTDTSLPFDSPQSRAYAQATNDLQALDRDAQALQSLLQGALSSLPRPQPNAQQRAQMDDLSLRQRDLLQRAQGFQAQLDAASEQYPVFKQQMQPSLDQAKQMMGEAALNLEGHQPTPALEDERQALRALHAMKRQLQNSVQKQRQEQESPGQDPSQERVAIPDADKRLHRLRQDVLDAMKQQGLPTFDAENNLYYRSLVE